jgi:hypothetical protein
MRFPTPEDCKNVLGYDKKRLSETWKVLKAILRWDFLSKASN